jgi:hypothetical protein
VVQAKTATTKKHTAYASPGDFCRIFNEDMGGLYRLGLLLTGDEVTAEQCFVLSLEDATSGVPVFIEWARSWARRTIVRNAIALISPKPGANERVARPEGPVAREQRGLDGVFELPFSVLLELPVFDRFVFIITVLEKMREHECCLLLGCSVREVVSARGRVFARLAEQGGVRDQAREFLQPAQVA